MSAVLCLAMCSIAILLIDFFTLNVNRNLSLRRYELENMVFTLFLATILIIRAFSPKRYPPFGVIHRRSFETFTSATFYIPACSRQQAKTYKGGDGKFVSNPKSDSTKDGNISNNKNAWLPHFSLVVWKCSSYIAHDLFCSRWTNYLDTF